MGRVIVVLQNNDGAYLFFRDREGLLTPPSGYIKVNEGPKGAASRIILETTGVEVPISMVHGIGPSIHEVQYNVDLGPTTLDGEEEWLDRKKLQDVCKNSPERLSEVAKEACEKGLRLKIGTEDRTR